MVTSISHRALRIVLLSMLAVSVGLANRTSLASGMSRPCRLARGSTRGRVALCRLAEEPRQFESIKETNAWKKLISIPALQMGWMQAETQWQFPTDPRLIAFKKWFDGAEGQDVWKLGIDMMSDECFMYADSSLAALIEVGMQMNSEVTRSQFDALRETGDADALENKDAIQAKLLELLDKYEDELRVPNLVFGFKVSDAERAVRVLDIAEARLRQLLVNPEVPEWVLDQMERTQVDGHQLLTLQVTSSQIPWDEIEEEFADNPELFEAIQDTVEGQQMVIALGVVEDFVVMTVSDSLDSFASIGSSDLLADTDEFQRLDKHASENIITIGYASERLMQAVGSQQRSFGDMATMAKGFLSLAELSPEQVEEIEDDIDELADDVVELLPEPGAIASATFTTERGYETYSYNWGGMPANLDATKPLPLVNHLGTDSLGWYVARGKQSLDGYEQFTKWCRRAFGHFEAIAESKSTPDDWQQYEAVREQAMPLLARLDKATRQHMIPGFADGQGAVVFDATVASDAWCEFMPVANKDLSLPTFALVYGVSDAGAVKQGATEYFAIVQDIIDKAHEANPDDVPSYTLPEPNESSTSAGTTYSYEFPAEWGANDRLAPNAALSDSVLVLSLLPEIGETLLAGSKPAVDGPAADFDRPLLSAGHFKFAKFIETTKPWIDYGIQMTVEQSGDEGGNVVMMTGMFKPQVEQFLEVVQCLDSYTGVTYREEDAWVTHGEMRVIDLED